MFDVPVLDFILGLFFIFLLYALLISGLNTFWGVIRGNRNKFLQEKIKRLLHPESDSNLSKQDENQHLFELFERDPLIDQLRENSFFRRNPRKSKGDLFPSALSDKHFYKILVNVIIQHDTETGNAREESPLQTGEPSVQAHLIDSGLEHMRSKHRVGEILWGLWQKSEGKTDKFEKEVETWFNDYMDHASQDFRRKQRTPLFVFGVVFSLILNIDAIHITQRMWSDSSLRDPIVEAAVKYMDDHDDPNTDPTSISFEQWQQYEKTMHLPIGWGQVFPVVDEFAARIDSSKIFIVDKLSYSPDDMDKLEFKNKEKYFIGSHTYEIKVKKSIENDTLSTPAGFDSTKVDVFIVDPAKWTCMKDSATKKFVCFPIKIGHKDSIFPCLECKDHKASPIGCARPTWAITQKQYSEKRTGAKISAVFAWIGHNFGAFLWKLVGFFISAFIASLGSPFWFDMMRKIISIKNAGKSEK